MVTKRIKTSEVINKFLREISKHLSAKKVLLFGSYARGQAKKYSDVDIAIISDDFKGIKYLDRLVMLGMIAWQSKTTEIEAMGFTVDEYNHASRLDLLGEIKRKSSVIYGE